MVERRHQLEYGTKHEQAPIGKGLVLIVTANIASVNACSS